MLINRIVIVGAGAVGGAIGGLLCHVGKQVLLVARPAHGAAIQQDGLKLMLPDVTLNVRPAVVESVDAVDWQTGDVALIATKLHDAKEAIRQVVDSAGDSVPIVCATNGVHAERWADAMTSKALSCVVWMPALFLIPGEVRVYCRNKCGILDVGPVKATADTTELANELVSWFQAAGFDSQFRRDVDQWKRGKWISNLANAAQALITDDWKSIARIARTEGQNVLAAAGLEYVDHETMQRRCATVELASIDNESRPGGSTWQSFQRDKPLETKWIEGAMAELGSEHGVPTPMLVFLVQLAKSRRRISASDALEMFKAID